MARLNDHQLDAPINPAVKADLALNFCDVVSRTDRTNYQQTVHDSVVKDFGNSVTNGLGDAVNKGLGDPAKYYLDISPINERGWTIPIGAHSDNQKKQGVPMTEIAKPNAKLPDVHNHPESSKLDGKCGITGVSNMLRFYGVEKNPGDIDTWSRRSVGPGMRRDKFAENCSELTDETFNSRNIENGDPLDVLKGHIKDGKPVAIMHMTGSTEAHWVVVTDVKDTADGTKLTVQSWGRYYEVNWNDLKHQWERGYGGPYPHVVGDKASEVLKKAK